MKLAVYIILAVVIAQGTEEVFVVIFECTPIRKAYEPSVPGKCLNLLTFFYVSFGLKLATDIVIFVMPLPTIFRTKMSRGKKMGVSAMFLLGLLYYAPPFTWNGLES